MPAILLAFFALGLAALTSSRVATPSVSELVLTRSVLAQDAGTVIDGEIGRAHV